jgi:hypothetical protein
MLSIQEELMTFLRITALIVSALMGGWVLAHGIATVAALHGRPGDPEDFRRLLIEAAVFIAGGVCILSVAAQQLYCWLTHRKDGGLMS